MRKDKAEDRQIEDDADENGGGNTAEKQKEEALRSFASGGQIDKRKLLMMLVDTGAEQ